MTPTRQSKPETTSVQPKAPKSPVEAPSRTVGQVIERAQLKQVGGGTSTPVTPW